MAAWQEGPRETLVSLLHPDTLVQTLLARLIHSFECHPLPAYKIFHQDCSSGLSEETKMESAL